MKKKTYVPRRISTIIIVCFSLFMVAILIIVSFISYYYSYGNMRTRTIADTEIILSQVGKNIGRYISNIEAISEIINTNKDVMNYLTDPYGEDAGLACTNFTSFLNYLPQIDNNIVSVFIFGLVIQKMRYESLDYKIEVSENALAYQMPKLLLQPLVENAIYHGVKNNTDGGTIWVRGYVKDEKLIFEIEDDGRGIRTQELENLFSKKDKRSMGSV